MKYALERHQCHTRLWVRGSGPFPKPRCARCGLMGHRDDVAWLPRLQSPCLALQDLLDWPHFNSRFTQRFLLLYRPKRSALRQTHQRLSERHPDQLAQLLSFAAEKLLPNKEFPNIWLCMRKRPRSRQNRVHSISLFASSRSCMYLGISHIADGL